MRGLTAVALFAVAASAECADVDAHIAAAHIAAGEHDGSKQKMPALAQRWPSDPHPYVVDTDSVDRYLTVARECAWATLATTLE